MGRAIIWVLLSLPAWAQMQMPGMPGMGPSTDNMEMFLMNQASGTSANPASAPMEMLSTRAGAWSLMFHGVAFLSDTQQTGPRGGDKLFSTNWLMGMAERRLGKGTILVRAMTSLEPATVTNRRYPELFQTGETAYGRPLADAQHPHDLFMELAFEYARPLGERTTFDVYLAPVGDPALGPVAFPHRVSALEIPQATLSHHVQDSTHISDDVITAGVTHGIFRLEASGFHGREPDEYRWDIDAGAIDSWSTRLSISPGKNWAGQVSVGRLSHPEALEPGDVVRATASLTYNRPLTSGNWAASVIWGRNHKTAERRDLNSYLAESVLRFRKSNYATGRIELVDKDELFAAQPDVQDLLARTAGSAFRIAAYTLGYTRDLPLIPRVRTGLGANVTLYTVPAAIKPYYGGHPAAVIFYMRVRPEGEDHRPSAMSHQ